MLLARWNMENIIEYLYKNPNPHIGEYVRGHLYLEYAMFVILERSGISKKKLKEPRYSFYKKVQKMKELNRISNEMHTLLLEINKTRNKMAHKLHFDLDFSRMFDLAGIAHSANVEFSDETIFLDFESSQQWYGVEGILSELIINTFYQLFYDNEDLFPNREFDKHLS